MELALHLVVKLPFGETVYVRFTRMKEAAIVTITTEVETSVYVKAVDEACNIIDCTASEKNMFWIHSKIGTQTPAKMNGRNHTHAHALTRNHHDYCMMIHKTI